MLSRWAVPVTLQYTLEKAMAASAEATANAGRAIPILMAASCACLLVYYAAAVTANNCKLPSTGQFQPLAANPPKLHMSLHRATLQ